MFCVRGCLYTSLAVQHGEMMAIFRLCLFEEKMETLDICEGAPSPSANAYRHAMYELFFKTYGKMARTICALLPNGDWRVRTRVQF